MNFHEEEEKLIRLYLLGGASADQQQQVEEKLLRDDEYIEQAQIIEDELVDNYVFGALSEDELRGFEDHFLTTSRRRQKLSLAEGIRNYAPAARVAGESKGDFAAQFFERLRGLFAPQWKIAAFAIILVSLGWGTWRLFVYTSPVNEAMAALNQAYRETRPVEQRITGFSYAEFKSSDQRRGGTGEEKGAEELKIDYVALERAKNFLFGRNWNASDTETLHALGKYYLTQKEFDKAIDQLRKALASDPGNAQLQSDLGAAMLGRIARDSHTKAGRRNEDVEECLKHLNRALALDPTLLEARFNRALLYQEEGLQREAREDWNKYLQSDPNSKWSDEARDKLAEIEKALNKVSRQQEDRFQDFVAAQRSEDSDKAFESFVRSYSFNGNYIVEKLIDGFLEARSSSRVFEAEEKLRSLSRIGSLLEEKTGDRFVYDLARFYRQARPNQLLVSIRAREKMAEANRLYQKAKNDQAVEKYDQARIMFDQAGNAAEALFAEAWIGHCHHQRSDTERNLEIFTRLVAATAKRKYLWMESNAHCGIANGHNSSGRFSQAIKECLQCGKIAESMGDLAGTLRSRYMTGYYYYELGKHEENLRISRNGLELANQVSANIRYAIPFYNLQAWSLTALGFPEIALAFQSEAVRMAEETGSPRLIAYAYTYKSLVLAKQKKFDEAIASSQQAITIGRELNDDGTGQDFVHTGLIHLGRIYHEAGKFSDALAAFDQVIEFFQRSKKQAYLYGGSKGRLLTLIAQSNDDEAQRELNRVIGLYETYRKSIQEESNRNSFFDQEQGIYDVAINFAYSKQKDPERAFEYSEICRARSLLDESHRGWDLIAGPEAPDLQIPAATQPAGAAEIMRQMPDRVQLLEYAVLDDQAIAWHISKSGVRSRVLNVPMADLNKRIESFLSHIVETGGSADQRWREDAYGLHDLLVQPVESFLDREKQLFIIPDKALTQLPFGALISRKTDKLLIEDYLLSYASSANMFLGLTEKARNKSGASQERLLVIGNPEFDQEAFKSLAYLPSAAKEAKDSAAFYQKPVVLIGSQATKNMVMREIERADIVHLASHYLPDQWSPMLSQVPLAGENGDALYVYELYRLRWLQPRLVVLSACRTRAEDNYDREGAMGVSRPFEAAGIPLIVASLWPVDTIATSDLMIAFHRARKQQGRRTIEALKTAQMEMLGSANKYRHPYYWAAFIVVGGYSEY